MPLSLCALRLTARASGAPLAAVLSCFWLVLIFGPARLLVNTEWPSFACLPNFPQVPDFSYVAFKFSASIIIHHHAAFSPKALRWQLSPAKVFFHHTVRLLTFAAPLMMPPDQAVLPPNPYSSLCQTPYTVGLSFPSSEREVLSAAPLSPAIPSAG